MSGVVYVSGRFRQEAEASINVLDHGLLYGDGAFEGIRAYNGRVFKLERHIERLFHSLRALRLELPHAPGQVADIVIETCRRNGIVDGYIRLVVTRGRGDLGLNPRSCGSPEVIVIAKPQMALYANTTGGVRVVTVSFRRPAPDTVSPSIKSLNYVNNILARIEANDRGADEALLLDSNGFVAEASADNLFIVTSRGLATPPAATNLEGITRETIMELAAERGLVCEERFFNLFEVWSAREVFICGTGAEVVPVLTVDGRTIGDGAVGRITRQLMDAYATTVRTSGTPIGVEAMR